MSDESQLADIDTQFPASAEQYNTSPITLARIGAYVRSTAVSTQTPGSAAWVSELLTNGSYSFGGVVSEILVFDRKLSDTEREDVYAYLSLKYGLDRVLPESMENVRNSASSNGRTAAYWSVEAHPNKKNTVELPYGSEFSGMTLSSFFTMPDLVYKSAGTQLANGTTLAGDTYSNIGS